MDKYVFELPMKVRDYEVDSEGIVNNARYLNYLEHTRHEFCAHAGLSFAEMRRRQMSPVVRRVEIDYLSSLGLGETFTSFVSFCRRGARFIFHQWIIAADGRKIVDAQITIVNVIGGRPSRGEEFAEAFKDFISPDQ